MRPYNDNAFNRYAISGKTTLISILTGVLSPSEGEAWVSGQNVAVRMNTIRKCIGESTAH